MQPIVLLYNLDDNTTLGRQVRRLCAVQKLRCRGVLPAQQGWPLSALLGGQTTAGQPAAEPPAEPFTDPMLVMAYFPQNKLDRLLRALRPLPPIPLKAVLTPHNADWSGTALHAELLAEHRAFTAGQEGAHT